MRLHKKPNTPFETSTEDLMSSCSLVAGEVFQSKSSGFLQSEVDFRLTKGVNTIFSHRFRFPGLVETWLMPVEMSGTPAPWLHFNFHTQSWMVMSRNEAR